MAAEPADTDTRAGRPADAPIASITPAISYPSTIGYGTEGRPKCEEYVSHPRLAVRIIFLACRRALVRVAEELL
jgi:hypothetical protein